MVNYLELSLSYVICRSQVIENLDTPVQLDSLYLGKNKITQIQSLSSLTQLTILSLQVWTVFDAGCIWASQKQICSIVICFY